MNVLVLVLRFTLGTVGLLACASKSAECVVDSIFKAVAEYSSGLDAFDDQTVVAIKVKDASPAPATRRK